MVGIRGGGMGMSMELARHPKCLRGRGGVCKAVSHMQRKRCRITRGSGMLEGGGERAGEGRGEGGGRQKEGLWLAW